MMKHYLVSLPLAGLFVASGVLGAFAANPIRISPGKPSLVTTVAGDCMAIGQRVAASQGGELARATPSTQNGREVCIVVVLVPGKDGERPRRVEVAVPAN